MKLELTPEFIDAIVSDFSREWRHAFRQDEVNGLVAALTEKLNAELALVLEAAPQIFALRSDSEKECHELPTHWETSGLVESCGDLSARLIDFRER